MATLKPESKREEFKRYLESSGMMDSLTRVLVSLYEEPERPSNAVEYFLERLASGATGMKAEMETLQTEIGDLRKKASQLEEENEGLKKRLETLEQVGGPVAPGGDVEVHEGSEGNAEE